MAYTPSVPPPIDDPEIRALLSYIEGELEAIARALAFLPNFTATGAAVADATDNASAILRLNELLARARAHGLIAT